MKIKSLLYIIAILFIVKYSIAQQPGSLTDSRDGKTYKTMKIGNQIWMAENLNFNTNSGSWCYENDTSNCIKYGRLYNWDTAKKVCPSGWHLPSDEEWITLSDNIGSEVGTKLRSTYGWNENGNGTDAYGFTVLPGGYRNYDDIFCFVESYGTWWSSTMLDTASAWGRSVGYGNSGIGRGNSSKLDGFSVRCVKDFK